MSAVLDSKAAKADRRKSKLHSARKALQARETDLFDVKERLGAELSEYKKVVCPLKYAGGSFTLLSKGGGAAVTIAKFTGGLQSTAV